MEANSTLGRIRDKSRIDANIGRGLSELIEGKTAPIASTSGQRWVYHFDFTNVMDSALFLSLQIDSLIAMLRISTSFDQSH